MKTELTQDELKVLFLVMCVVSSDFEATFRERNIDRIKLVQKLGTMTEAQ